METEGSEWIPEFYTQLQGMLKEWLLVNLPSLYGQKPERKILPIKERFSSHINNVKNTDVNFNLSAGSKEQSLLGRLTKI